MRSGGSTPCCNAICDGRGGGAENSFPCRSPRAGIRDHTDGTALELRRRASAQHERLAGETTGTNRQSPESGRTAGDQTEPPR